MYYINFKYRNSFTETIDECETRKEARFLLGEYRFGSGNPDSKYWIPTRSTKEWRERIWIT